MERLAIFDVDFTITKRETLLQFLLFMSKKRPKLIFHIPKSFYAALLYALRIHDEKSAKEMFISFINEMHEDEINLLVKEFYEEKFCKIFYRDAIDMIKKLKKEGCKIYLISASPEFYLKELYAIQEVDMIIGTKFIKEKNKYKNCLEGRNCKGEEKVRRLIEVLKDKQIEVDFKNSYMFSDSLSDTPLLELVGNGYLINYKKNHDKFEVLKWK